MTPWRLILGLVAAAALLAWPGWQREPAKRPPLSATARPATAKPAAYADSPLSAAAREQRLNAYFRDANAGWERRPVGLKVRRDVSASLKRQILARDAHRCVVCGSRIQLEVDHRVALMNGGDNRAENLATLCDACHLAKTRMDNSLRRKRERLAAAPHS